MRRDKWKPQHVPNQIKCFTKTIQVKWSWVMRNENKNAKCHGKYLIFASVTFTSQLTMQIFVFALACFQILIWYLPIRTEICRITISITMLVVLQRISIIYLPLQPKLEIIRNIFRSGFDLSLGQTESISGRGKLQMDRKCQNPHCTVLHIPPYSKGAP